MDQAKQECKWTLFLNLSLTTTEAQAPFQPIKLRVSFWGVWTFVFYFILFTYVFIFEHLYFKKRPADGANGYPRLRTTGLDPS